MMGAVSAPQPPPGGDGPPPAGDSSGRTGRPPVTSRAQILAAARRIIDRDGWEKLSIRRLAAELGIGATTVYHHVRDREDLLIQLLNDHAEQTLVPELPDDPRERIIAAATAMHESLVAWPWTAEVLAADGFIGRLGEPARRMVEVIIDAALDRGCTAEQAVDVFRSIWYYTAGEILVRVQSKNRPGEDERIHAPEPFFIGLDHERLPRLAALGNQWPVLAGRDTYAQGLRAFVDGLLDQAVRG